MTTAQDTNRTFLLNSHQGVNAADGWRVQTVQNLQTVPDGLRLATQPEPPVLLKDAEGTFGGMENPTGIAVAPDGTRYVSDSAKHLLYKIPRCREPESPAHESLACLGGFGSAPRQMNSPRGLTISQAGELYVSDSGNHRIQVFALQSLALKAIWGKQAAASDAYAPPPSAGCLPSQENSILPGQPMAGNRPGEFNTPWDVIADRNNDIYIADKENHRVQKYYCRTRRFDVFDGTILAARFFQILYGPSKSDRFVYVPARARLELWPHSLGADPANTSETVVCSSEVRSLREARRLVLERIDARGARDILVE